MMKQKTARRALITAVVGTIIAITAINATAETRWERRHPRRDQVNDRLERQNRRIHHEVREGELTRDQARQLHREDRAIRHEEHRMASLHHGHITKAEQKALNQQENAVSRQIPR